MKNTSRKVYINLLFFLISIIVIVYIWPEEPNDNIFKLIGRIIIVSSCYIILYQFLVHFRSEILGVTRKTLFIIIAILSFIGLTRVVIDYPDQHIILLIPFAIIPVIIRTFYDARLALFILLICVLLAGFIVPEPFEFVFISFITGMLAIFTLSNIYRKARLFLTSFIVIISFSSLYVAFNLMQFGNLQKVDLSDFIMIAGNGLLVLISYPLIFMFEENFLFLTDSTLLELADTNQPLLKKACRGGPWFISAFTSGSKPGRRSRTYNWG